ncbi:thioredoxin family protein [Defluviimonas sp. WL0002]|uniref:Thioredoxin family protein n=1 Tax=Albidovulum marisflavi TaxID=2984159 RepID=A0ABT2ZDD0_9RHOB|nr:thioredoxin family protein [Defluviimonas sp. WL0002]MCV2868756.1 thioredoxin family protein [Defluviimonas sp. WL0002]
MAVRSILASLALALSALPTGATEFALLMFEQPGCMYCARWNEEIAPEYPLTAEGRAAPLQRLDLRGPLPQGIQIVSHPIFTPTFVLVADGVEAGRIEGYPGEDFFWPMLGAMLRQSHAGLPD